jgi:glycosyltransferase involved in cell wall biosynthesis
MNILITAPNLNSKINVSGISTVVNLIIEHNFKHNYFHFEVGRKDIKNKLKLENIKLFLKILYFPIFIKKNRIELIHQNVPLNFKGVIREFIINKIAKYLGIKIIVHIHGGEYLFRVPNNIFLTLLIKSILNKNKNVLVLSELEKSTLTTNYNFNNSIVLPNAIVIQNLPIIKKNKTKIPVFLFLGRIHESKGIFEIIEMFKILKKEFQFKFIIYGEGSIRKKIVEELKFILGDRFEYGGVIFGKKKFDSISKCDYFLLPSRYGEGLPLSLLESMSLGLIPIVSDDGSMKYLIQDGENGILVNKKDPFDLYLKISTLIQNPKIQKRISQNARKTVIDFHNIEDYIIRLNYLYK